MMKNMVSVLLLVFSIMFLAGCASKYKKAEKEMKQPINCATAEGDIRMLNHEKAHVTDQIGQGVTALVPAGLVVGVASGSEGTKARVATGEYNKMIDKRIAEIKEVCGLD